MLSFRAVLNFVSAYCRKWLPSKKKIVQPLLNSSTVNVRLSAAVLNSFSLL